MNSFATRTRSLLAVAVGAVIACGAIAPAFAQQTAMDRAEMRRLRHEQREQEKQAGTEQAPDQASQQFPQATRVPAETAASEQMTPKLQEMVELFDADKGVEARALADEIIASEDANAYDTSFAAQLAAQIALDADDIPAAMGYLQKAVQSGGLDNNGHYNAMVMLAQMQLQQEQYDQALVTINRVLEETGSQDPSFLVIKGNALYRLQRYPQAQAALTQAIEASPEPQPAWTQLLMATYAESGQQDKAAALATKIGASNPADKGAQMNMVAVYQQSGQLDKAAEVLEQLRAAGKFTEDQDYRLLYSAYLNMEGKEQQAAQVIREGLDNGVLEPDYQAYLALAQASYFSDQIPEAIAAYQKAAPLADDGGTWLNLARILSQEGRVADAKAAAQKALAKGLDDPEDANKILALPGE